MGGKKPPCLYLKQTLHEPARKVGLERDKNESGSLLINVEIEHDSYTSWTEPKGNVRIGIAYSGEKVSKIMVIFFLDIGM